VAPEGPPQGALGEAARSLREELVARLELARAKDRHFSDRRHGVPPV